MSKRIYKNPKERNRKISLNNARYWLGKKRSLAVRKKMSKCNDKHHLDLDEDNNSLDNIIIFTHSDHQRFHRLAYHYLLEKFGIKEIKLYLNWFYKIK